MKKIITAILASLFITCSVYAEDTNNKDNLINNVYFINENRLAVVLNIPEPMYIRCAIYNEDKKVLGMSREPVTGTRVGLQQPTHGKVEIEVRDFDENIVEIYCWECR